MKKMYILLTTLLLLQACEDSLEDLKRQNQLLKGNGTSEKANSTVKSANKTLSIQNEPSVQDEPSVQNKQDDEDEIIEKGSDQDAEISQENKNLMADSQNTADETQKLRSPKSTEAWINEDAKNYQSCDANCALTSLTKSDEATAGKLHLYMDRSGSMSGFKSYFSNQLSGIITAIEKSVKKGLNLSQIKFFGIKNRQVNEETPSIWKKANFDGASSDIDLAFDHMISKDADVAVIFTDGMPSYGKSDQNNMILPSKENSCINPSNHFEVLSKQFKKVIDLNYQVAIYHQNVSFNGKYYMNCGELSADHKKNIEQKYQTKVLCKGDKSSECAFKYEGFSPYLMIIISKMKTEAPLYELMQKIKPFQKVNEVGFSEKMIKIWPSAELSDFELERKVEINHYQGKKELKTTEIQIENNQSNLICHPKAHEWIALKTQLVRKEKEKINIDYLVDLDLKQKVTIAKDSKEFLEDSDVLKENWLVEGDLKTFFDRNQKSISCKSYYQNFKQFINKNSLTYLPSFCQDQRYCLNQLLGCQCLFYKRSNEKNLYQQFEISYHLNQNDEITTGLDDLTRIEKSVDPTKLLGWSEFLERISILIKDDVQMLKSQKFVLNLRIKNK
jgi:hypothetical protein